MPGVLSIVAREVEHPLLLNRQQTRYAVAIAAALDGVAGMFETPVDEFQGFFLHRVHHLLKHRAVMFHHARHRTAERVECV